MPPFLASALFRCCTAASLLVGAAGFSGCAHTYNVKVDALCNPQVTAGSSYRLVPRDEVKADFDPNFAHAVGLIETALASRGYFRAADPHAAETVIEIDFGVASSRKRVTEDLDLFYEGSLPAGAGAPNLRAQATAPLGAPVTVATPPDEPPPTRVTVVTVYEKFLTIAARETPRATSSGRKPAEAWRITVAVEDSHPTVDECLPVLILTAADKLGTSTGARQNIRVSDRSPAAVVMAANDH